MELGHVVIGIISAAIASGIFWFFAYRPLNEENNEKKEAIEKIKDELDAEKVKNDNLTTTLTTALNQTYVDGNWGDPVPTVQDSGSEAILKAYKQEPPPVDEATQRGDKMKEHLLEQSTQDDRTAQVVLAVLQETGLLSASEKAPVTETLYEDDEEPWWQDDEFNFEVKKHLLKFLSSPKNDKYNPHLISKMDRVELVKEIKGIGDGNVDAFMNAVKDYVDLIGGE